MNLSNEMVPGLFLLITGAGMSLFADGLCKKKQNQPQIRLMGVGLAIIGAILIFIP